MVARINRFFSRSDVGLRNPRSISRNITPGSGGVAVHWGGPRQGTTGSSCSCANTWRNWQNFHMNSRGWADIAYSFGFCNHGNVFAGRGFGARTAANGTNDGNQRFYAACWIGGQGETPSLAATDALEWIIREARSKGGAGREVSPHQRFTGSTCPGSALIRHASILHNKNISTPTPAPKDIWEELGLSDLSNKEKEALRSFANYLAQENVRGDSFGRQLLQFHREERPQLNDFLQNERTVMKRFSDELSRLGSTPLGAARAAVTLWREAGARGWKRDHRAVAENKHYTAKELGLKESL